MAPVPVPTDALLAAAFAAGDREAGDALFARYAPDLRRFLAARCHDWDLADELMQEVAARLVTAAPRLDPERNARAYLFRTARNVWLDHLRREITRRQGNAELAREDDRFAAPADAAVMERELLAAVRRAVAALPQPQREVLELRHQNGITFREIAGKLRRPLGTVLTQMHAALKSIEKALENYK